MNTTLELLRQGLAGHDADLTGLMCDRALRAPRVAPSPSGSFDFDLYTSGDLPVDIFSKTSLPGGPL